MCHISAIYCKIISGVLYDHATTGHIATRKLLYSVSQFNPNMTQTDYIVILDASVTCLYAVRGYAL